MLLTLLLVLVTLVEMLLFGGRIYGINETINKHFQLN